MAQRSHTLTPREIQVMWHMGRGLRNKEIAGALGIDLKTVEAHVRSIFLTLGATNRIQAVLIVQDLSGLSLIRPVLSRSELVSAGTDRLGGHGAPNP